MFKYCALTICLLAVVLGENAEPSTQVENYQDSYIVGGKNATVGQFRYLASLRTLQNAHFCGGVLVNSRWIVTAAHCTINRLPGNIVIVLGTLSRTRVRSSYATSRIVNHPDYNASNYAFDISVVQSVANIATSATIQPASLGSSYVESGVNAIVSGWGVTKQGNLAETLQYLSQTTLTNEMCKNRMGKYSNRIFNHKICAGGSAGQAVCSGDSGGALAVGNTVIGIVSWGVTPCGGGFPDVYDRISSHRNWILSNF